MLPGGTSGIESRNNTASTAAPRDKSANVLIAIAVFFLFQIGQVLIHKLIAMKQY